MSMVCHRRVPSTSQACHRRATIQLPACHKRADDDDDAADDDDDDDDDDNVSFVVFRFAIKVNVWAIGRDTKECNWNSGAISFNRCNALIRSHEIEIEIRGIRFLLVF